MALETGLTHGFRFEGNSNDVVGSLAGTDVAMTYNTANGKITQGAGFASASPSRITYNATISDSIFTIHGWIFLTSLPSNAGIIEFAQSAAPYLRVNSSTSKLELVSANVAGICVSSGTISTGVWTHVGVTYDASGNYVFYINGAASGSGTSLATFTFALGNAKIGTETSNGENLNGSIDELYTHNVVKSGSDFTSFYNSGMGMYYNGSIFVNAPLPVVAGGNLTMMGI